MSNSCWAAAMPVAIAALLPWFDGQEISFTDGNRLTTSAVLSVEPSSTTITSLRSGWADAIARTAPILGPSLNAQMMHETRS